MRLVRIGYNRIAEHLHSPDDRLGQWAGVRDVFIGDGDGIQQGALNLLRSGLLADCQRIAARIAIPSHDYYYGKQERPDQWNADCLRMDDVRIRASESISRLTLPKPVVYSQGYQPARLRILRRAMASVATRDPQ